MDLRSHPPPLESVWNSATSLPWSAHAQLAQRRVVRDPAAAHVVALRALMAIELATRTAERSLNAFDGTDPPAEPERART